MATFTEELWASLGCVVFFFVGIGISALFNYMPELRKWAASIHASLVNEGNEEDEPEYADFEELTDEEAAAFLREHKQAA